MFKKLLSMFGLALASELSACRSENKKLSEEIDKLKAENERLVANKSNMKMKYRVGYVEAKRRLRERSLRKLEELLKQVPDYAQFGGTAIVYRNNNVEAIEIRSKADALGLVKDAKEDKLALVF